MQCFGFVNSQIKAIDAVEYVNPLMGTQSLHSLSNGNTYPAICRPWGMNFWTPQTGKMGDGWAYTYTAEKIKGFKQTHQPSPWMNDYGQFSIMPVTGKLAFAEDERASWFSHKAEVSKPYYYSVYLADYDVTTEITTTERAAHFQITFPENENSSIVIDAFDKGSYIKIIPSENKIIGYTTRNSGGVPDNFKNYFVLYFDKSFTSNSTFNEKTLEKDKLELTASHAGAVVAFKTKKEINGKTFNKNSVFKMKSSSDENSQEIMIWLTRLLYFFHSTCSSLSSFSKTIPFNS